MYLKEPMLKEIRKIPCSAKLSVVCLWTIGHTKKLLGCSLATLKDIMFMLFLQYILTTRIVKIAIWHSGLAFQNHLL